jgi:hypothetical protein
LSENHYRKGGNEKKHTQCGQNKRYYRNRTDKKKSIDADAENI